MVNLKNDKENSLGEIEKLLRPNLLTIIIATLVCIGPYGNLILRVLNKDYDHLLTSVLLTFPTLIIMCICWFWYLTRIRSYKKRAKEIYDEIKED